MSKQNQEEVDRLTQQINSPTFADFYDLPKPLQETIQACQEYQEARHDRAFTLFLGFSGY